MTLATADNPPACFPDDVLSSGSAAGTWWGAVRARPRHEKALARDLCEREVAYCLPMVTREQRASGRVRASLVPLFSGYLFACGDEAAWRRARETGRIVHVLPVADGGRLCSELRSVVLAILHRRVEPCPIPTIGTRVTITRGPLAGIEGILLGRRNRRRLVLRVEGICQAVRVDVDASELER